MDYTAIVSKYFIHLNNMNWPCNQACKETERGTREDNDPLRVYFPPYSLRKATSCPLAVCVYFFSNFVEYIVPFVFVFSSVFLLSLSHTQLYISLSPWLWLFFFYPLFLLMSSFVCIFLSVFLPLSSFPSVPLVFTSCSAVEGSRGGKGMLILSPQRRSSWERDRKRDGKKMALVWENEMAIAPCVCMSVCTCVCASPQKRSGWQAEWHFCIFSPASHFPLPSDV